MNDESLEKIAKFMEDCKVKLSISGKNKEPFRLLADQHEEQGESDDGVNWYRAKDIADENVDR